MREFADSIRGWDFDCGDPQEEYEALYAAYLSACRDRNEARAAADELLYVIFHHYGDEQAGALLDRRVWERFLWLSEYGKDPQP